MSDEVSGIEIFDFKNKKVGRVLYSLWTCKSRNVDGFVVIKNNFLQFKFFLPFSSVDRFEDGNIYLIKNYKTRKTNMEISHKKVELGNREVFVSKYTFDTETGWVKSVEIAKSIYEDIQSKRKIHSDFVAKNGSIKINQ